MLLSDYSRKLKTTPDEPGNLGNPPGLLLRLAAGGEARAGGWGTQGHVLPTEG